MLWNFYVVVLMNMTIFALLFVGVTPVAAMSPCGFSFSQNNENTAPTNI